MPLFKLNESEIRESSKKHLETLEYWLRSLIENKLTENYGAEYWNYYDENEVYIIKKDIREKVTDRLTKYPERFSRWIDATLLEHLIHIVCKEKLYKDFFKPYFEFNFPLGKEQLKYALTKLSEPRNRLYHSNPISVRQVEQIICYSNDIIESIKEHYIVINKNMDFNAPEILSFSTSNGVKIYRDKMIKASNGLIINHQEDFKYRCGDKLKMEIEVDSSFNANDYDIIWSWNSIDQTIDKNKQDIEIQFSEKHVGEVFSIIVKVISKKTWHRYNQHDDQITLLLKILPPI